MGCIVYRQFCFFGSDRCRKNELTVPHRQDNEVDLPLRTCSIRTAYRFQGRQLTSVQEVHYHLTDGVARLPSGIGKSVGLGQDGRRVLGQEPIDEEGPGGQQAEVLLFDLN